MITDTMIDSMDKNLWLSFRSISVGPKQPKNLGSI
jgi:hypothetical protein